MLYFFYYYYFSVPSSYTLIIIHDQRTKTEHSLKLTLFRKKKEKKYSAKTQHTTKYVIMIYNMYIKKLCDVHVMVVHKIYKTKTTHSHGKTTSNIVVMSEKIFDNILIFMAILFFCFFLHPICNYQYIFFFYDK